MGKPKNKTEISLKGSDMVDSLLSRLQKVKRTGAGRWVACCPAHEDKSPSLSVRLVEDGRILLHCFAGCSTDEVLGSVGMDMNDLFPEALGEFPAIRRPFHERDVLACIRFDLAVITCAAATMIADQKLEQVDRALLLDSVVRVEDATRYAHGL